ncbi:hypothetical protein LC653_01890 [Nostoc sp. CHAB 5784]|uniref:hypothetical protein n=1 Tax=Nostoc mirabile TaxID=2907820 RepID=UPI001E5FE149|nr:hypothetical protein [Nostoc mirabile]MCC5662712.1 hypothetical protein [Nostoc mirabile CHAB5784]
MDSLIQNIPVIIEKSGNPFGILALIALVFTFVAFIFFRNADPRQRERVFIITTLFLLTLIVIAFIAGIAKERDPLFVNNSTLGGHVTIDATAGLQNSGIYLEKGEKVLLESEGRVHLASDQIVNFIDQVRYFIVQNMDSGKVPSEDKQRYGSPPVEKRLKNDKVFRRNWTGPDGEDIQSPFRLDQCKLRNDLNWGMLLAVVLPGTKSKKPDQSLATKDPVKVLNESGLKLNDLEAVTKLNQSTLTAVRDGWLTFIINDAIISPLSEVDASKEYFAALVKASDKLASNGSGLYKIPQESIPLIWYSDNVGAFRITVKPA